MNIPHTSVARELRTLAGKPHIQRNKHRHAPYLWHCRLGRCNGYADTPGKAYVACMKGVRQRIIKLRSIPYHGNQS